MSEQPYWKRLIDEATRARPDLSYKFKSAAESAAEIMRGSPDALATPAAPVAAPVETSYTDTNILPGRPTHPFEVRVMVNEYGMPVSIRCYKGLISDSVTGNGSSYLQGTITQPLKRNKRVRISGSMGIVSGDQQNFVPSNYDGSGPEQQKYTDYNDPFQTSFIPSYQGLAYGTISSGKDPDPEVMTATFGTGTFPIGYNSFTATTTDAYFEWPYSSGPTSMVRLFCKDDGVPAERKWGIWGGGAAPDSIGTNGFFILIAQITGTDLVQFLKSDVVVIGGVGGAAGHPLRVVHDGTAEGESTYSLTPGTVNNLVPAGEPITVSTGPFEVWLKVPHLSGSFPHATGFEWGMSTPSVPPDTDAEGYVLLASVNGATVTQYITGSLWGDRIKLGTQTAQYYYARV